MNTEVDSPKIVLTRSADAQLRDACLFTKLMVGLTMVFLLGSATFSFASAAWVVGSVGASCHEPTLCESWARGLRITVPQIDQVSEDVALVEDRVRRACVEHNNQTEAQCTKLAALVRAEYEDYPHGAVALCERDFAPHPTTTTSATTFSARRQLSSTSCAACLAGCGGMCFLTGGIGCAASCMCFMCIV